MSWTRSDGDDQDYALLTLASFASYSRARPLLTAEGPPLVSCAPAAAPRRHQFKDYSDDQFARVCWSLLDECLPALRGI